MKNNKRNETKSSTMEILGQYISKIHKGIANKNTASKQKVTGYCFELVCYAQIQRERNRSTNKSLKKKKKRNKK